MAGGNYGHLYTSAETRNAVERLAKAAGVPMSQLITHAILWYGEETSRRLAEAEAAKQAKLSA